VDRTGRRATHLKKALATRDARLVAAARAARSHAYAPYSRYRVGAAILTRGGRIYRGCNVENASYGATLCAERAAVAAMVTGGHHDPVACAIVTTGAEPAAPCGICRQVLAEFAREMRLLLVSEDEAGKQTGRKNVRLAALLPLAFRLGE
jgi:cytidine deaminase